MYIVQGTLIQHLKELVLQSDLCRDDVLFYYTTTGWMMWNWLVSGLAAGMCVLCVDVCARVLGVDVCTCTGCRCVHVQVHLCTRILTFYCLPHDDVYLLFIQLMWVSRRCLYLLLHQCMAH